MGENPAAEINEVRERAFAGAYDEIIHGFPNQPVDVNPQEAILRERFLEFIMEGKRWYDLRRMGDSFVYAHTSLDAGESYKLLRNRRKKASTEIYFNETFQRYRDSNDHDQYSSAT